MAESHIRIDDGVSRGPKKLHTTPAKRPEDIGLWHVPAGIDPDEVIERYLSDATTSQIAASYGVTRKALTRWLRDKRPEKWRQAQAVRALCMKEDSQDGLESACDALSLARARELLRSAQWDLQALDADFQPKQMAVNVNAQGPVSIQIVSFAAASQQDDANRSAPLDVTPQQCVQSDDK